MTALAMGADHVVDPAQLSPFTAWRELAYGSPDLVQPITGGTDMKNCVAFECVGVPGVLNSIVRSCERGTRIFSAGGPPEGEHLHTMTAKRKGLNMQFGGGPMMPAWNQALEEVMSGRIDVTPMSGRVIGLDEMPQAINDARDANGPARIVVQPWR
jgi:threonine dehydrogenase-like Zn-dependent dehydrogenase